VRSSATRSPVRRQTTATSPAIGASSHIYQYARAHGTGTGQALLEAAVGDRPAYLWTAEDNPRALAFYTRNGFIPDGTRKIIPDWENMAAIRMVR
jgi:GNAT superfamily N-acetyltransferase